MTDQLHEVMNEQKWQYLTILQKMDFVRKNGCPAVFITQHDIKDTQHAFGLGTEKYDARDS
jgi:hypothetical protein